MRPPNLFEEDEVYNALVELWNTKYITCLGVAKENEKIIGFTSNQIQNLRIFLLQDNDKVQNEIRHTKILLEAYKALVKLYYESTERPRLTFVPSDILKHFLWKPDYKQPKFGDYPTCNEVMSALIELRDTYNCEIGFAYHNGLTQSQWIEKSVLPDSFFFSNISKFVADKSLGRLPKV